MTPAHRRQLAEQLVSICRDDIDGSWDKQLAAIDSALSSAYRAGQIAALKEAADYLSTHPDSQQGLRLGEVFGKWLRARATQLEEGTETT